MWTAVDDAEFAPVNLHLLSRANEESLLGRLRATT